MMKFDTFIAIYKSSTISVTIKIMNISLPLTIVYCQLFVVFTVFIQQKVLKVLKHKPCISFYQDINMIPKQNLDINKINEAIK